MNNYDVIYAKPFNASKMPIRLREFLKQGNVQKALFNDNIEKVYELAESEFGESPSLVGGLTKFLESIPINIYNYVNYIPSCCYAGSDIVVAEFPEKVSTVGFQAFFSTLMLKSIKLHAEYISKEAFAQSGVQIVILEEGVKEIEKYAFAWCDNLKTILIPDSVVYIDDDAFEQSKGKLVLCVYEGSYAHQYAEYNNITVSLR